MRAPRPPYSLEFNQERQRSQPKSGRMFIAMLEARSHGVWLYIRGYHET